MAETFSAHQAPRAPRAGERRSGPILFYDGDCGLCARSVQWILRHDRRGELRFAPLQGATYAALDVPGKPRDLNSMVLWDGERLFVEGDAWARVLKAMGGWWGMWGGALKRLPRRIRDGVYRFIARRRHRLATPPSACPTPTEAERRRMLD